MTSSTGSDPQCPGCGLRRSEWLVDSPLCCNHKNWWPPGQGLKSQEANRAFWREHPDQVKDDPDGTGNQ